MILGLAAIAVLPAVFGHHTAYKPKMYGNMDTTDSVRLTVTMRDGQVIETNSYMRAFACLKLFQRLHPDRHLRNSSKLLTGPQGEEVASVRTTQDFAGLIVPLKDRAFTDLKCSLIVHDSGSFLLDP